MQRLPLLRSYSVLLLVPTTVRSEDTTDPAVTAIEKAKESTDHQLDVLPSSSTTSSGTNASAMSRWSTRPASTVRRDGRKKTPPASTPATPSSSTPTSSPRRASRTRANCPLLVLPHGGVHADFTTYYAHIVRELLAQGYIVVAPEYRGSTGYGRGMYEDIDYGGLEVDDALAARDWVVENHPRVDAKRVGILGWSHGGLITLFSLFRFPDAYACGFAGVPVSDLVQRMGYHAQGYRDLYEAEYFIGESAQENLEEYKRRSPVWSVDKLTKPLRIHTNIHDEDVNYIEVEHLTQALTTAGKNFEYEVSDVPGGHSFDRLDTPEAWGYRKQIYAFLARYLKPPKPQIELGITAEGRLAP